MRLQVGVGALGAVALAAAISVLAGAVTLAPGSAGQILAACGTFVLPHLNAASVAVLVLGSLSFAAIGLGLRAGWREVRSRRCFLGRLGPLERRCVSGGEVLVFDDPRPQAFCAGLMRPRVYASSGTLRLLEEHELAAVMAHERHHARRRDPARLFVLRIVGSALFFLPLMRRLAEGYGAVAEMAADQAALRQAGGNRQPLAAALLRFESSAVPGVVAIAPDRVDHLLGRSPRWPMPVALTGATILALGAFLAVTARLHAATTMRINLPLLGTQLCMAAMVLVPLVVGAAGLLGGGRILRRPRRVTSAGI